MTFVLLIRQGLSRIASVRTARQLCLQLAVILVPLCLLFGENKSRSYEKAAQLASDLTDVFSAGPVEIRATVRLHAAAELKGSFAFVHFSKDTYREHVNFPNFRALEMYKTGETYILRSERLEPLPVAYLRILVYGAHSVVRNARITSIADSHDNGSYARCYRMEGGPLTGNSSEYGACFDNATGALVSWDWRFNSERQRFEYSDFVRHGTKLFPRTMRFLKDGKLLLEVNVDSIGPPLDKETGAHEPPPNAVKLEPCKKFDPAQPDYSHEYFRLRSDTTQEGSVVLAGALDDRGKFSEVEVQQSIDPKTDQLALRALKTIRISPAKCDGRRIPSFFRLQIWFSPPLHADNFQSFR